MSDRFVAPRSNIFIQNFACRTMFHLLTGLSNMMFDKNVRLFIRENRARLHYRELSCACARAVAMVSCVVTFIILRTLILGFRNRDIILS